MKTNLTQRKFRAEKSRCCQMWKGYNRHRETKRTVRDVRAAIGHQQQIHSFLWEE